MITALITNAQGFSGILDLENGYRHGLSIHSNSDFYYNTCGRKSNYGGIMR